MQKSNLIIFISLILSVCYNNTSAQTYNYAEVLQKSLWFYEVQRSGKFSDSTNRVEWRASSALKDGSDSGLDLTGGWYDAGDNMKFNFPMASAVTLLAWGGLEYYNGYKKCQQWGWLLANIKWVTDYFIKCHPSPNVFYGQIGLGSTDHKWWGSPEVFPNDRPSFRIDAQHPGSDLAAEAAAALASSSMLFRGTNTAYSDTLLQHAKELYSFAYTYRGLYSDAITDAASYYKSWSGYNDELVWGAIWLYIATADTQYLAKAEKLFDSLGYEQQTTTPKYKEALSWDDKTYSCYVLLAKITNNTKYHTDAQRWLDWWSHGYTAQQAGSTSWPSDSGIAYTTKGLAWIRSWGPLRYAANTAFAALVYSECANVPDSKKTIYFNWAKSQIDYALGNNEQGRSYVCGFGTNPPVKPHHRSMHGPWLDDNGRTPVNSRHILFGALVGGPSQDGSYTDDRLDATRNEVADDYNAGFSSALARLVKTYGGNIISDFPQAQPRDTEYAVVAKINTIGERFTEISVTIQNRTTWPARYSKNAAVRYFVNLSEVFKAGFTLNDIRIYLRGENHSDSGMSVSGLKQYENSDSIYYVEISFAGETIFPGGQSAFRREAQIRIGYYDSITQGVWNPDNDFSYTNLTTTADTLGDWYIPAYEDGKIVWGHEPDGTSFKPSTWSRPAFTEPQYNAPVWNTGLFKGAGDAVAYTSVKSIPDICGLSIKRGTVRVYAFRNINVRCLSLDGRLLYSSKIMKSGKLNIRAGSVSSGAFILQIIDANSSCIQSKMILPF